MNYYHLRYNIYPPPGFPVEKEEWVDLSKKHNEQQVKQLLISRHQVKVSLILSASVGKEEYESKSSQSPIELSNRLQVSMKNEKEWHLAEPANMLKKLNDDSALIDKRYRNICKPTPLL
jgi:hypothetical protein